MPLLQDSIKKKGRNTRIQNYRHSTTRRGAASPQPKYSVLRVRPMLMHDTSFSPNHSTFHLFIQVRSCITYVYFDSATKIKVNIRPPLR